MCLSETLLHYLHTLAGGGHKYIHVSFIFMFELGLKVSVEAENKLLPVVAVPIS